MKYLQRTMALVLSGVMLLGALPATAYAAQGEHAPLIGDIAVSQYTGDEAESFIKISHPDKPASKMEFDPIDEAEPHAKEVFSDGLVDYIANSSKEPPYGIVGVPHVDEGANGQGDRGQTYAWASYAYGDWMYVSTLYNSTSSTSQLLGFKFDESIKDTYGDDMFYKEPDGKEAGSTLCKINVKTGEVKILMSRAKNGLETSFRNAVKYRDKLYFCGSVNHLPSIYEIDPETDAFQCVYQDPSMRNYPGGPGEAWKEARRRRICPTIRGLAEFKDYLVISTVGMDGNPYIAVSDDPSSGEFTQIAWTWKNVEKRIPGELCGYPACRIQDSIMGGSIWEMIEYNDKLYVAIATGTPENAPDSEIKVNDKGEEVQVIKDMQSFALISGECHGRVDRPEDWEWTPIVGDMEKDDALYTFGIDPERKRASACNLVVYKDHLYIGEYNDTQIAFVNAMGAEFDYLARNLDQSVSLYRLDKNNHIEKVMGDKTKMFPTSLSGINESGFGRRETQYIWQSRVFDGKLYLGTFDETGILRPIGKMASEQMGDVDTQRVMNTMNAVATKAAAAPMSADGGVWQEMRQAAKAFMEAKKTARFADYTDVSYEDEAVLLPGSLFDQAPLVKVDSPVTLYQAMLAITELMENKPEWDLREQLAAKVRFVQLFDEITSYIDGQPEGVPAQLMKAADTLTATGTRKHIKDMKDVLMYMKNSISGFDMYVTEDGEHFKQITRTGLDDPYNHGLRSFASNDDPHNRWMAIGTANPFYGTQIWRMESKKMNINPVDPDQIDVRVRFVNHKGKEVQREWDKAGQIYVDEGTRRIDARKLDILVPGGYELVIGQRSVPVEKKNGEYVVTVRIWPEGKLQAPVLTATNRASDGSILLNWEKVPGAKQYEVYRSDSGKTGTFHRLYTTSNTSLRNGSARPGETYYYMVRAVDGTSASAFGNVVSRACDCARPDAQVTVRSDGKPYITWNSVQGADRYEVWSARGEGKFTKLYTTKGNALRHGSADVGETYRYRVRALVDDNQYARSAFSYIVQQDCVLGVPSATLRIHASNGKPYLTWDAVDGAQKYEVYRAESKNGEFTRLTTTSKTTVTNTGAVPGETYYYKVRAVAGDLVGKFSSVKHMTCDCARPTVKVAIRDGKPVLSWNAVDGADRYEVVYSTDGGETFRDLHTAKSTTLRHGSAKAGRTYT